MAAYSGYMCKLFRQCHILRNSVSLTRAFSTTTASPNSVKRKTFLVRNAQCVCLYSSQTNPSNPSPPTPSEGVFQHIKRPDPEPAQSGSDKDKKKQESTSGWKNWTGKNAWKLGLVFLGGWCMLSGGVLIYSFGAPELDPEGNEIEDEFSHLPAMQEYLKRAFKAFSIFEKQVKDPSRDKLLPDPVQFPYIQPPYTLVIEMIDILVHPEWTYTTGWRFKKRPGLEYFLQQIGPPLFEVVIYTAEHGFTADPIVNSMDPNGFITYRLYRDATRYERGHHVKDLSCLNRDLSKVIVLDWNNKSIEMHPNNAFLLRKWKGEDGDRTLFDLATFLRTLGSSGVADVRPVLEYYSQFDDPIQAFKDNQKRIQEEQDKLSKEIASKESAVTPASKWSMDFLRRR